MRLLDHAEKMTMKIAKALGAVLLGLLALYGFGRFFFSQIGRPRAPELAGVIAAPPPDYQVVDRGAMTPAQAAEELRGLILARPSSNSKLGIKFASGGSVVYWLADMGADVLEERAAGASGTRVQTVWHGHVLDRLQWARMHGDPSAPGLPAPERKNLYH
jgi:hypothetical protein